MTDPIRLEDLPDVILLKIAQYLELRERRTVLPLISRGWARLLEGPSPAWEQIRIIRDPKCNIMDRFCERPNLPAMEAWLSRRAGAVRNLRVSRIEGFSHGGNPFVNPILPASVLKALGSHAHQLRVLRIELPAIALSSTDLNAVLRRAPNLEQMTLEFSGVLAGWDDRGAALMQTLSQLPALQSLTIYISHLSAYESGDTHPTVVELAALSSAQLTRLNLCIFSSSEGTLSLGAFPALTECRLSRCGKADVHITAASISGTPNLTSLCAHRFSSIQLAPDYINSLSLLTELRFIDCGLRVVPPALAGVQRTLRVLDLSFNHSLRVKEIGYGVLLSLSALKYIDMFQIDEHRDFVWDIRSAQYLSRFHTEWQALRPGVKLPQLVVSRKTLLYLNNCNNSST